MLYETDWIVPKKITIVESNFRKLDAYGRKIYEATKGFIVNTSEGETVKFDTEKDKAIAVGYVVFNENKKAIENAEKYALQRSRYGFGCTKNPTKHTLDGDTPFKLKILTSADDSSQSGKLSFWMCEIWNDELGIDVAINIHAQILCRLLLESTFINGVCQDDVVLVKMASQLGAVAVNSKSHKNAIRCMEEKSKKKGK